ncbi:hypothetical protein BV20DRAFT_1036521 [Pilatotrama ljubarskyi]|nr:hypothetical protein BV20DRAFT_1036521 [Pilatotrama ljubarskyi]
MQQPGFNPADVADFDAAREVQRLDTYFEDTDGSPLSARDGWISGSVNICLPMEGVCYASEQDAPTFTITGVYYRSLTELIQNAYQQPCLYWLPPSHTRGRDPGTPLPATASRSPSPQLPWDSRSSSSSSSSDSASDLSSASDTFLEPGVRVYSEIYDSDALLMDDAEIHQRPREAQDTEDIEYVVAPLMLWSDSTHLANFGTASLWPAYIYFGSQSKYTRGKPTAFAAHHLAYIPSLPDTIQDAYTKLHSMPATAAMLTFLRRELMQAVWLLILDDRFMYIYVHGLLLLCGDTIRRRLFPRFQFHAADYVEKILQACLKYFARCPCPRCCINKDKLLEMGTRNDAYRRNHVRLDDNDLQYRIRLARRWIFEEGVSLTSVHMKRLLDPLSNTPTQNAFSVRLREHGFNYYSLYVPDLMHEFELGVWKSVLTHILRILYAAGGDTIQELNRRFRQIPTFGRIRKFSDNVADQRRLAARDYENNLRTSLPVVEALLDGEDNKIILDMIFALNMWHCLAKLRVHTEPLLHALSVKAVEVGRDIRKFAKVTCAKWPTVDLPKEAAARGRRKAAVSRKTGKVSVLGKAPAARRQCVFNLNTYKYHSIRDYPTIIRARTNKNKHELQIAQHMRRAEKLRVIKGRVDAARQLQLTDTGNAGSDGEVLAAPQDSEDVAEQDENLAYSSPWDRYHIADSQRDSNDITAWVSSHRGDPAFKGFIARLKDHLGWRWETVAVAPAPARLHIVNNRIYHHRVFRINYTTYDVRRAQDSVNPRSHPDILMLASHSRIGDLQDGDGDSDSDTEGSAHRFAYARVIGIFHVNVRSLDLPQDDPQRMDVLWVRWLVVDHSAPGGFPQKRLHRLQFVKDGPLESHQVAFGFVNPRNVIRGIHLIPAFAHKRTGELLGPSQAARVGPEYMDEADNKDTDFCYYYVNMFADRDIFLRFHGGGIGHSLTGCQYETHFHVGGDEASPDDSDDDEEGLGASCMQGDAPGHAMLEDSDSLLASTGEQDLLGLAAALVDDAERLDDPEEEDEDPDGDDSGDEDEDDEGRVAEGLGDLFAGDEYAEEGYAPL